MPFVSKRSFHRHSARTTQSETNTHPAGAATRRINSNLLSQLLRQAVDLSTTKAHASAVTRADRAFLAPRCFQGAPSSSESTGTLARNPPRCQPSQPSLLLPSPPPLPPPKIPNTHSHHAPNQTSSVDQRLVVAKSASCTATPIVAASTTHTLAASPAGPHQDGVTALDLFLVFFPYV